MLGHNLHKSKTWYWLFMSFMIRCVFSSVGDSLPDFQECVAVCGIYFCFEMDPRLPRQVCIQENCQNGDFVVPFHLRLLLWTCPSNCDHTCQHIVTDRRVTHDRQMSNPVVQFHGKWPFHRFLGVQEPFSVAFSFLNFLAHRHGLFTIREKIPANYPLRHYYILFGYIGLVSWLFSIAFHTRDLALTEMLDYLAAGASVLYGLYFTPVRIFRLDRKNHPAKQTLLRLWTLTCILLYIGHVTYLTVWRWDYTYNMAANVAVGVMQNILWTWFSLRRYRNMKQTWTAWPGLIVAWIIVAMSLELLDFAPISGMVDAHSLWHLGTVGPTIWWYKFLVRDAFEDIKNTMSTEKKENDYHH